MAYTNGSTLNAIFGNSTNVSSDQCYDHLGVNGSLTFTWFYCIAIINAPLAVLVDRLISPFWYLIGITGNIITIKIWTNRRMRRNSTCALYLTVLAMTDLLLLFFHVFKELKFSWMVPTIDFPVWCSVFFVIFMFAQYMSPLLVFGFTVERFISIINPFRSERFSRYNRAHVEITGLIIFALSISMVQAHGWVYAGGECTGSGSEFFYIWSWVIDILMFGVVPITVLFLNIFVMRAANKSLKLRNESSEDKETTNVRVSHRNSKLSPTTATLLWVSFYRIFTTLPVSILFALQSEIPYGKHMSASEMNSDPVWRTYFDWFTMKQFIDEIGLSQYSCNIFIYLATAKRFRNQFKDLCPLFKKCQSKQFDDSVGRRNTYSNGASTSIRMTSLNDQSPIMRNKIAKL